MADEDVAVTNLRDYLKIRTVEPNPDYAGAVKFLSNLGNEVGLDIETFEVEAGMPIVILTHKGRQPNLQSIMLYSHMDVVPAYPEHWKYDPYSGYKDENGDIYGRGSQDMKCNGIWYIGALRRLKQKGLDSFLRTIHIVFGPDEETYCRGMKGLVKHERFREMNVAFSMDEGIANEDDIYRIYYTERNSWWIKIECHGNPGHASRFLTDTASEKLHKVINKFMGVSEENLKKFIENPSIGGELISVNLTKIEGGAPGLALNVVPELFTVYFDMRLPPTTDFPKFKIELQQWIEECGKDISLSTLRIQEVNAISDPNCVYVIEMTKALDEMGVKYQKEMFPGGTDSKYLREVGVQSVGFSPMIHTQKLLHEHNEHLNERQFLTGLAIYEKVLPRIANVPQV